MTTAPLAKHYHTLSAEERLPLIMAASARGDEVEYHRLMSTAPRQTYRAPHTFGLAAAFEEVAYWHRMEMLSLAGQYVHALGRADSGDDEHSARLLDCAMLFGCLFKAQAAGWRAFCAGLHLDPDFIPGLLPGQDLLGLAARFAEHSAFTAEEALAYVRRRFDPEHGRVLTADDVAAGLRQFYDARCEAWG